MNHPSRLTMISTVEQLKMRISEALPGSVVEVSGGGGHLDEWCGAIVRLNVDVGAVDEQLLHDFEESRQH